ncbi:enoyl-CoA hydratase/isomerase family protein [Chloroflexota bacterium]
MDYEGITLDKKDGVATITLDRPQQLNAITLPMAYSLAAALDGMEKDNDIKALILTGAGRGFCAGLDATTFGPVAEMSPEELGALMRTLTIPLDSLSIPTIAAVNGATVGAGLSLALVCDMRIASEKARFASGYLGVGLIPDVGGTYSLPRIVGTARAMELMITGDPFGADEAERLGIVNRVVPDEELMKAATRLAEKIARGPSVAIKLLKQAVRQGINNSLEQQIEFECFADYTCFRTEDHKEGIKALLEKRTPEFRGE